MKNNFHSTIVAFRDMARPIGPHGGDGMDCRQAMDRPVVQRLSLTRQNGAFIATAYASTPEARALTAAVAEVAGVPDFLEWVRGDLGWALGHHTPYYAEDKDGALTWHGFGLGHKGRLDALRVLALYTAADMGEFLSWMAAANAAMDASPIPLRTAADRLPFCRGLKEDALLPALLDVRTDAQHCALAMGCGLPYLWLRAEEWDGALMDVLEVFDGERPPLVFRNLGEGLLRMQDDPIEGAILRWDDADAPIRSRMPIRLVAERAGVRGALSRFREFVADANRRGLDLACCGPLARVASLSAV